MDIFTAIYFVALIIEIIIRAPIGRKRRQEKLSERRFTTQEKVLLGLLSIGGFFIPIMYAATHWLDYANYVLPDWAGWLGGPSRFRPILFFARPS